MGGSGCGKTTLLKHMIGLKAPVVGRRALRRPELLEGGPRTEREQAKRRFGVLFQSGALWSSMTLAENVALPLRLYTALGEAEIRDVAAYKLALVGPRRLRGLLPQRASPAA